MRSEHEAAAESFARGIGLKVTWSLIGGQERPECSREGCMAFSNHWKFTIQRNGQEYSGEFTDSVVGTMKGPAPEYVRGKGFRWERLYNPPSWYALLTALQNYPPGTHAEWCAEMGVDTDSRRGLDQYLRIQEEWAHVSELFHDVLDKLRELQ